MPVIKSAKKKLRKDKKRKIVNDLLREGLKKAIKDATKNPSLESIKKATKATDKAAKNNLMHKNKAARIKSKLSKLVKSSPTKTVIKQNKKTKTSKAKK